MNYKQLFNNILLEGSDMGPSSGTHDVPENASQSMFEQDF